MPRLKATRLNSCNEIDGADLCSCSIEAMNVRPAPPVPGKTESERMDSAVRTMFTVPKTEIQRREAQWQKANGKPKPEKP